MASPATAPVSTKPPPSTSVGFQGAAAITRDDLLGGSALNDGAEPGLVHARNRRDWVGGPIFPKNPLNKFSPHVSYGSEPGKRGRARPGELLSHGEENGQ